MVWYIYTTVRLALLVHSTAGSLVLHIHTAEHRSGVILELTEPVFQVVLEVSFI